MSPIHPNPWRYIFPAKPQQACCLHVTHLRSGWTERTTNGPCGTISRRQLAGPDAAWFFTWLSFHESTYDRRPVRPKKPTKEERKVEKESNTRFRAHGLLVLCACVCEPSPPQALYLRQWALLSLGYSEVSLGTLIKLSNNN